MRRRTSIERAQVSAVVRDSDVVRMREVSYGARWMPRLPEAMKDVTSCEKPRGVANEQRSADVRMGQPGRLKTGHPPDGGGEPAELKHLSRRRKRNQSRFRK